MASRPQLECVIGESGAGKTLYVAAIKLVEFLRNESGKYWHNLPLKPEGLAALSGKSVEEIESRLELIPQEELKKWIDGKSGPWEFFADKDIKGAHIAIDEAHRYFGKKHSKAHLAQLGFWTGELRHHGATCELLTQHEFKLSTDARNEAGVQTRIFAPSQRTELFTGAKWYDVLQILAKFRGRKIGLTIVREGVPTGKTARDFKAEGFKYIFHKPAHYACYDSFNNISAEGAADGSDNRPKEEWERYSWGRLLAWYIERNFFATGLRAGFVALVFWAFCLGGLSWMINGVMTTAMASTASLAGPTQKPVAAPAEPQPTLAKPRLEAEKKLAELAEHNRFMAIKLQEAAEYAEQLTGLVAVVGDAAYWADGSSCKVGEVIAEGPYAGKSIEAIDPTKGAVTLTGGVSLRVGVLSPGQHGRLRSWLQAAGQGPTLQPIPDSNSSATERNLRTGPTSPNGNGVIHEQRPTIDNGPVQSNPNAGVYQPPRRSIRMLRGGGTGFGLGDSDSGVSGHPDSRLPGDSGQTPGGGIDRASWSVLPRDVGSGGQGSNGPEVPSND